MPWKGLVTDSRIQFKLVKVTRTKTAKAGFTTDDAVKKVSTGGIAPIDPKDAAQPLGVRADRRVARVRAVPRRTARHRWRRHQLPAPSARSARRKRRSPRAAAPRTKSVTTSTCGTSGATRRTAAARTWSPTRRTPRGQTSEHPHGLSVTCNNGPNGDMFVNYMDYTDDAAMFMFTSQQVQRMRAALETARSGLI